MIEVQRRSSADRNRVFASVVGVLIAVMCVLLSPPGHASQARTLTDGEKRELEQAFSLSLSKLKGPYAANTCVCTDGRSAPVQTRGGALRNICGEEGTLFCSAFKAPWGEDLEQHGVYIANIFSRDLYNWDTITAHGDLVRGYILERYLADAAPNHKLSQLRRYTGLSGAEHEILAQPRLFEQYLALDGFDDARHFLLAYELQKRFFARGGVEGIDRVRDLAFRIHGRDAQFKPLKDAVHNQVSASLMPMLRAYRDTLGEGETRTMVDALIAEIDGLTSPSERWIGPLLAELDHPTVAEKLAGRLNEKPADELEAIEALASVMVASRLAVAGRKVLPADARRLVDLNIVAAAVIRSRGAELLDSGDLKSVGQHVRLMQALANAAYGTGLLSPSEREAAMESFGALLAEPAMDRREFLRRLSEGENVVAWARNGIVQAFSGVWAQWTLLMPAVADLPDDILRGSPVGLFEQVGRRLERNELRWSR